MLKNILFFILLITTNCYAQTIVPGTYIYPDTVAINTAKVIGQMIYWPGDTPPPPTYNGRTLTCDSNGILQLKEKVGPYAINCFGCNGIGQVMYNFDGVHIAGNPLFMYDYYGGTWASNWYANNTQFVLVIDSNYASLPLHGSFFQATNGTSELLFNGVMDVSKIGLDTLASIMGVFSGSNYGFSYYHFQDTHPQWKIKNVFNADTIYMAFDTAFKLVDGSQGAGKVLTSDANGTASWTNATGSVPGGHNTWVQYNNSGTFAGDTNLRYTYYNGCGNLWVGNFDSTVNGCGILNSNNVFIQNPNRTGTNLYANANAVGQLSIQLPANDGFPNAVLTTDGSGTTRWDSTNHGIVWSVNGNSGTNSSNFMGTIDDKNFFFRTSNIYSGGIGNRFNNNIALGAYSMPLDSGLNNIAIGVDAYGLASNSNSDNLAIGVSAMYNGASGNENIAIGVYAGMGVGYSPSRHTVALGFSTSFSAAYNDNAISLGTYAQAGNNQMYISDSIVTLHIGNLMGGNVAGNFLTTDGANNASWVSPPTMANDQFTATPSQSSFTLTYNSTGAAMMTINGFFVDNTQYTTSGILGVYYGSLSGGERVNFFYPHQ